MFGTPPPVLPRPADTVHAEVLKSITMHSLSPYRCSSLFNPRYTSSLRTPVPTLDLTDQPTHPCQPGDSVLVKRFTTAGLAPPLEGTLHSYPDHTHCPQGGRTNGLDSSHPRQGSPAGRTMEHQTLLPQFAKAKTCALFVVTTLATLICAVNPYSNPPLEPKLLPMVLTEGSTGGYGSSLTGKGSTLVNLTLEYIPKTSITFSLDLCALLGAFLTSKVDPRTKDIVAGCDSARAEDNVTLMDYICAQDPPHKKDGTVEA
ncbi:hypothetical protein AAY473_001881 [Plecturocebus cupreus]